MEGSRISQELERLILELSANCNIACAMCGFGGKPIDPSRYISQTLLSSILDDDISSHVSEIRLNGRGESTIHPQFVEIVRDVRNRYPSAHLSLFTNLMFKDENLLKILHELNVMLFVSVDSVNKELYEKIRRGSSFNRFQKRLQLIKEATLVFTLQPDNITEIASVCQVAANHGFGFILNVVRTDDPSFRIHFQNTLSKNWELIIEQLQYCVHTLGNMAFIPDYIWSHRVPDNISNCVTCGSLQSCPIVGTEIMIGYDGVAFPCNMFNPTVLGNLTEEHLNSIINGQNRKNFITCHKDHYYCNNCAYILKV